MFQEGDLVLFRLNPDNHLPTKLTPKFDGPFEVQRQYKNDVLCKHVVLGTTKEFHVSRLKLFHVTLEEAKEIALLDQDQYVIDKITAYRGDPLVRTTTSFEVQFKDGTIVWKPWDKDLSDTIQFEDFCSSRIELYPLLHDSKVAAKLVKDMNKSPITEVQPGDIVLVDIRCYGATWYSQLPIPDPDHIKYLVEYEYGQWVNKRRLKIKTLCKVFNNEKFEVDHDFVYRYGQVQKDSVPLEQLSGPLFRLVDADLIKQYPQLLK